MSIEFNKLGKTEIANTLKIVSKDYSPDDFFAAIKNQYLLTQVYEEDEIVVYENELYISLVDNNVGHTPTQTSEYWQLISDYNKILGVWNDKTIYKQNSLVYYNKAIYTSLINNNLNNPPTDTSSWSKLVNSFLWSSTLNYSYGEFVAYGGNLYYSLQDNNLNKRPSDEFLYWELFSEYGTKVEALLIELNGTDIISGQSYQVTYDNVNYKITIVHNLGGRVNGIIYDADEKQAFFGIDYVNNNTVSIQMNSESFPNSENVWKIGLCLGSGFSVRQVNYDDTAIRQDIIDLTGEVSELKRQIATLEGGMEYIGEIDLTEYRNSSEESSEESSGE